MGSPHRVQAGRCRLFSGKRATPSSPTQWCRALALDGQQETSVDREVHLGAANILSIALEVPNDLS